MKYGVLFGLFVLFSWGVKAQSYSEMQLDSIFAVGYQKYNNGEYAQALSILQVCMQQTSHLKTDSGRRRHAWAALWASQCYEQQRNFEQAAVLQEEILEACADTTMLRIARKGLSQTQYHWAYHLMSGKDYAKARKVLQRGLDLAVGEWRTKSLQAMALCSSMGGTTLLIQNSCEEAYDCFLNALTCYQELGNVKEEAATLDKIAIIQKRLLSAEAALQTYSEVAVLAQQASDTLKWVEAWKEECSLLKVLGMWDKHVVLSMRLDSLLTATHDVRVQLQSNYEKGDNARDMWGSYPLAESFYRKNLALIPQLKEPVRSQEYFSTYLKLCGLSKAQHKYEEALGYNAQCLACITRVFSDPLSPNRYGQYQERADIFYEMGLKDSAFRYMDSLFVPHRFPATSVPIIASNYTHRALLHMRFKEYDEALSDYEYAGKLLSSLYPEENEDRMYNLLSIANCRYWKREYAKAKTYYVRYADLCRNKYGENSLEYVNALSHQANIEGFTNEKQAGCRDYREAVTLLQELIRNQLRHLPEKARAQYWNELSSMLWDMTGYGLRIGVVQDVFTWDAYNALLFSKGLLLESEISMRTLLLQDGTPEDMQLYNQLAQLQSLLAKTEKGSVDYAGKPAELYSQIDRIDKQLARNSAAYGNYTHFLDITYEDIRKSLKEGEVVLDFTDFKSHDGNQRYAAYILRKEWEHPLLVSVFTQAQFDSLSVAAGHIPDRLYQSSHSTALLKLCWEPLSPYIYPHETVYYVPSGLLHRLALESVAVSTDSVLGDRYRFIRLSSSREICRMYSQQTAHATAALYGGLYYDVNQSVMDAESKKYDVSHLLDLRGNTVVCDSAFRYLAMSRGEVTEIGALLNKSRVKTDMYTGASGNEESFLHWDGRSPHMIHLATHGFYYTPEKAEQVERLAGYQNAMLLSGLVMSGGNAGWKGDVLPSGVLDGIMTADKISRLNLKGTELVVLSACNTGLGSVNSEGLFGLQRAFKKAGVQTLVMSLWEVSDYATKEFMVHFYRNLTTNGWDKRKAFEDARTSIRRTYVEPFYWAGFIMLD